MGLTFFVDLGYGQRKFKSPFFYASVVIFFTLYLCASTMVIDCDVAPLDLYRGCACVKAFPPMAQKYVAGSGVTISVFAESREFCLGAVGVAFTVFVGIAMDSRA